jgi:hypothetical protein
MIAKRIDRLVEWTKWPAAFAAVASIPLTSVAIFWQLSKSLGYPVFLVMFVAGFGLLCFAARTSLGSSHWVKMLFGWLHDGTQAAVAMLMLHPVVGIRKERVPDSSRVRWLGKGNWIMLVSPYIVPLSTILLWLVSLLLFASLRSAVLGFGLGLHLAYVGFQWNSGTSELRRLGRKFCWMFLPAANVAIAGFVFAFAIDGFSGAWGFGYDCITMPWSAWEYVQNLVAGETEVVDTKK